MKTKYDLTSNEYYGGLNRRYDRRAALLRKLGFTYVTNEWGAFFTRRGLGKFTPIPAGVVGHADYRAFIDRLRSAGVRTGCPNTL